MKRIITVLLAATVLALPVSAALAQYPPAGGNVTVTTSDPNPDTGATVNIPVAVLDATSGPVADAACTATVSSQPGSDASVSPPSFTTDSEGKATLSLSTGSSNGAVTVEVSCGDLDATVTVPIGSISPPDTGAGLSSSEERGGFNLALLLLVVPALGAAGIATARVSRRS